MLVSNLMFDEILMYKKARKMQHSQTEKGIEQENETENNSFFLIKTYKFYYQMTNRLFVNSNSELKLDLLCI
jgi:hypothetical protein